MCKKNGLNPLAVHFDNGWNSELAVKNIENCLDVLGIDLVTYVIEWDYFKEIQKAFLQSSTPDGEIPTDHAINAQLFNEANKRGIKSIASSFWRLIIQKNRLLWKSKVLFANKRKF